jgi:hypothetical protein
MCNEPLKYEAFAVVSPWIRERIKTRKKISRIGVCKTCGGGSFSFRYSDKQMSQIYNFYRDDNYNKLRFKWEKWYGDDYQQGHVSKEYLEGRKKEISDFLAIHLKNNVCKVIDIGGGNGELIPDTIPGNPWVIQKHVLDLSSVDTIANVTKIDSLSEVNGFDLAIYSHVIEHVAKPISELENILKHTNCIYVETPFGVPKISFMNKSIVINILFALLSLNSSLWRNMFALSVGFKSKKRIFRQSEHINFFETDTIYKLGNLLNCDTQVKINLVNNPLGEKHHVIQALFCKK